MTTETAGVAIPFKAAPKMFSSWRGGRTFPGQQPIDLSKFTLTFADEFNGPLSASDAGPVPGTSKWMWHVPMGGDFGFTGFSDVFSTANSILTISAHTVAGAWHAGVLCSVDQSGSGFAQKYGYFEMRAQFPSAGSTWPAFWLLSQSHLTSGGTIPAVEIDIVEQFANFNPQIDSFTYHNYGTTPFTVYQLNKTVGDMSSQFHTYGVSIDPTSIIFYFDRFEIGRILTPPEANTAFYVLVDLALSSSTPDGNTADPSLMLVDYVRVSQFNSLM